MLMPVLPTVTTGKDKTRSIGASRPTMFSSRAAAVTAAGAIGVGIGLGLQSMAANLISGFIIIFGGKVRKGDWIKVEESLGMITDIHPLSTRESTSLDGVGNGGRGPSRAFCTRSASLCLPLLP